MGIESKTLGNIQQPCLSLEVVILGKCGPTRQSELRGQTTIQVGSKPCPSVNRLPKDHSDTQLPLISSRDKAPPTRGIEISSTYQWIGISPSHQETYNKPLFQFPAIRGADIRSKRGYNSIIFKKVTTPKTYKNEKTEL